jgi:hypothetical protein
MAKRRGKRSKNTKSTGGKMVASNGGPSGLPSKMEAVIQALLALSATKPLDDIGSDEVGKWANARWPGLGLVSPLVTTYTSNMKKRIRDAGGATKFAAARGVTASVASNTIAPPAPQAPAIVAAPVSTMPVTVNRILGFFEKETGKGKKGEGKAIDFGAVRDIVRELKEVNLAEAERALDQMVQTNDIVSDPHKTIQVMRNMYPAPKVEEPVAAGA